MGICQFGDLEESLVSKDDLMKISRECKIPSFDEKNIIYIKPIGQGSFGVIYLIEEKNSKKQYALKSVLCNDIEQILKHKKEFELLYSLNHPNLIKIYNVLFKYLDMTTYILYVIMEKAETDWNNEIEIKSKMKRNYTEKELINIMKQLVNVLLYFQKNKIAHRDIKPQNILIFPNNVYKVSDLGEAKNTKNNIQYATLKGNQFFMSPNLFFAFKYSGNSQKVKHNVFKSDVFSLGYCFLYAMSLDLRLIKNLREKTLIDDVILIIKQFGLENKYSTKFMSIIYKMIQTDENKRFDFIELNAEINKNFL
jgi:serine/threonine protein kinase